MRARLKLWLWLGAFIVFVLLIGPMALLATIASVGAGSAPDALPELCATDASLEQILATIRAKESSDNYLAQAEGSSASGGYQIVDGTWDGYGGYTHAADAPPQVQDAKAAEMVRQVLETYDGDVSKVPVFWYLPSALDDESLMDQVPYPGAGNTLTIRQYQQAWLDEYQRHGASGAATGGVCYAAAGLGFDGELPDLLADCDAAWGGYRNGHIPHSAMRYSPASNYLHPAASQSFDQLYAAAQAAGLDLRGNGYRAAEDNGSATRGTSCHGAGMAVDIAVLVTDDKDATAEFDSPEFAWLCANAERYGWVVPRWAMPKGMRCGGVVGNGVGGCRGDDCGYMEPWHVEAVGVAITHPDFAGTVTPAA